jgi:hypothetical protein
MSGNSDLIAFERCLFGSSIVTTTISFANIMFDGDADYKYATCMSVDTRGESE